MSRSIEDPRLKAGDAGIEVDLAAASVSPAVAGLAVIGLEATGATAGTGVAAGGEVTVAKGESSRASPEIRRFFVGRLSSSSSVSSGSVLRTNEFHWLFQIRTIS
jgi:hypothetical protein